MQRKFSTTNAKKIYGRQYKENYQPPMQIKSPFVMDEKKNWSTKRKRKKDGGMATLGSNI
jgi:hypothetical protein